MAGNGPEARPPRRGPRGPRIGRGHISEGAGGPFPAPDPDLERHGLDEAGPANAAANDGREARFVSWRDLQRVADEAADIDAVVQSELETLGKRRVDDEEAFAGSARPPRRRRLPAGAFLAVLFAAAIAAAFLIVGNGAEQPGERATSPIARTSSAVPTTPPSPSPPVVPPKAIVARLSFSAPCWVEAVADGRTVFAETITDGSRTIRAKRTLLLTLGNAGGVDLVVNGRPESTGAAGEVVQLSFALEGGRVTQLTS